MTPCQFCKAPTRRVYKDGSKELVSSCKPCADKYNANNSKSKLTISIILKKDNLS